VSDEVIRDETIRGEWWWIAVLFDYVIHQTSIKTDVLRSPGIQPPGGYRATLRNNEIGDLGTITITGTESDTHIYITAPVEAVGYWQEIIAALQRATTHARRYKRSMIGPVIDQTLDTYYRLRAAGSKVTLKQLATQADVSYPYLRKRKIAYDRNRGNKSDKNDIPLE
jgi:hypothetical protein